MSEVNRDSLTMSASLPLIPPCVDGSELARICVQCEPVDAYHDINTLNAQTAVPVLQRGQPFSRPPAIPEGQ